MGSCSSKKLKEEDKKNNLKNEESAPNKFIKEEEKSEEYQEKISIGKINQTEITKQLNDLFVLKRKETQKKNEQLKSKENEKLTVEDNQNQSDLQHQNNGVLKDEIFDMNVTKITKTSLNKKIPLINYEGNKEDEDKLDSIKDIKKKRKSEINTYDMDKIKMLELLGKGGFGEVFRAYDKITGKLLAIKYFKEPDFNSIRDEDHLMSAVERLNDQNYFIKYYGLFKDSSDQGQPDKYIIIMESGDINLMEVLKMRKKYEIINVLYIFNSLVNDFVHLQLNSIATRDVKTENIILIQNEKDPNLYNYKISDFGIGCILKKGKTEINNYDLAGYSYKYAAPEIKLIAEKADNKNDNDDEIILINYKDTYDPFKADVFSLGITILDLLGLTKNEFNQKKEKNDLYDLIQKMLKEDPQERISFIEILKELNEIKLKSEFKQPIDELIYIKEFIDEKNKGKNNVMKLNEYLSLFNNYYDIGIYKIANDFLDICFYDIYLKNENDIDIKDNEIEGRMFFEMGKFSHLIRQDYVKAEEYYIKSLTIREKVLGLNHQDTATSYNNLANFYKAIKQDYVKAEEYYIKSLNIRETVLGHNHQDTAGSYNNLAIFYCYIKQDFVKAEEYYIKSLAINENVLGFNHKATATSYNNLANFYHTIIQNPIMAEEYYINALNIREKLLGFYNQDTAASYNCLANFYSDIKQDYVNAEEYFIKSLIIREKVLGLNHQDTATSYNDLAAFYHNIKKDYVKAENYYIKTLTIFEKVLGFNHQYTVDSYKNICRFYEETMKDQEKALLYKRD